MTLLGTIALWLTLLMGTWVLVVGTLAVRWNRPALSESSRRAALVLGPLLGVAVLSLAAALLRRDLNVAYVSEHVSRNLSIGYSLVASLAGWNGFGLVALNAVALLAIPGLSPRRASSPATLGLSVAVVVGTGVLLVVDDPFRRLGVTPVDGRGLDPLLLGPVLTVERPLALLGLAAVTLAIILIPAGSKLQPVIRWLGVAWLLLTASLTVGLWQAYRFVGADGRFEWSWSRSVAGGVWLVVTLILGVVATRQTDRFRGRLRAPGPIVIVSGLVCLVIAAVGSRGGTSREVRVKAGGSISVASNFRGNYSLTHMGVSRFQMADRVTAAATLDATRNEKPLGLITSDKRQYFGLLGQPIEAPVTTVGIHRGVLEDIRAVFRESTGNEEALYQIRVVPLVSLLWLGSALLLLGGFLVALGLGE